MMRKRTDAPARAAVADRELDAAETIIGIARDAAGDAGSFIRVMIFIRMKIFLVSRRGI